MNFIFQALVPLRARRYELRGLFLHLDDCIPDIPLTISREAFLVPSIAQIAHAAAQEAAV